MDILRNIKNRFINLNDGRYNMINNSNIYKLINDYFENRNKLPENLKIINNWDVSRVTNMNKLFYGRADFNEPLNDWNVSNVTSMVGMFMGCETFDQPLNKWDVSNVVNMNGMFKNAKLFNQTLNEWNVSNVVNMGSMFENCVSFDEPLDNWNISKAMDMTSMFSNATAFNQPLNDWNLLPYYGEYDDRDWRKMGNMFVGATSFVQPLNNWRLNADGIPLYMIFDRETINKLKNINGLPQLETFNFDNSPVASFQQSYEIHREFYGLASSENNIKWVLLQYLRKNEFEYANMPSDYFINHMCDTIGLFIRQNRGLFINSRGIDISEVYMKILEKIRITLLYRDVSKNTKIISALMIDFIFRSDTPLIFKEEFTKTYIQDNIQAYGTNHKTIDDLKDVRVENISCFKGMLDRISTTFKLILQNICIFGNSGECQQIHKDLALIYYPNATFQNFVVLDFNTTIQEWSAEVLNPKNISRNNWRENDEKSRNEIRQNFIEYMRNKYKENGQLTDEIAERINRTADEISYVFDSLQFGGKNRTAKKKKIQKTNKKTKRKTIRKRKGRTVKKIKSRRK